MAWTPPKTWRDTVDRLNAANLNQFIRDNQVALRADAAALEQRVSALESGGFSDSIERAVNVPGGANRVVLTDLTPPTDTRFIYLALRLHVQTASAEPWVAVPFIDYSIWSAFTEVAGNIEVASVNYFPFYVATPSFVINPMIAKGTGGVLAFGQYDNNSPRDTYDRIAVRWYR